MPKRWSDVENNPAYLSLPPEKQAEAQNQYFSQVVAPQVKDPSQLGSVRSSFMQRANRPRTPDYPTPSSPDPSMSKGAGLDELLGNFQKAAPAIRDVSGVALGTLPIVEAGLGALGAGLGATGAITAAGPVALGLGLGATGGYYAKKFLDASGATDALTKNGAAYRARLPKYNEGDAAHPLVGGTAYNLAGNMANELLPNGVTANLNEATPDALAAGAGAAAGVGGKAAMGGLGEWLTGARKIPTSQSGNALLSALEDTHGPITPEGQPIAKIKDMGQFRDATTLGKNTLQVPMDAARAEAYDAARAAIRAKYLAAKPEMSDADLDAAVQRYYANTIPTGFKQAIATGVAKGAKGAKGTGVVGPDGTVEFDVDSSSSQPTATASMKRAERVGPKAQTLEYAYRQKQVLSDKAFNTSKKPGFGSASRVYGDVSNAIDDYIKSLVPEKQLGPLEDANASFSGFSNAKELFDNAATPEGTFSPAVAKAMWNNLGAKAKLKMDPNGVLAQMMEDKDPGVLTSAWRFFRKVPRIALPEAARLVSGMGQAAADVPGFKFNAPDFSAPNAPTALGAGGISSLLAAPPASAPSAPQRPVAVQPRPTPTPAKWRIQQVSP